MEFATGLTDAIYLEGLTLATPPRVFPRVFRAESHMRSRLAKAYRDSLQPGPGYPVTLKKLSLTLTWNVPTPTDIAAVEDLISWGGPLDVCIWKAVVESFAIAVGSPLAGTLTRRNALTAVPSEVLPTNAATRFAVAASNGGTPLTVTLGTPDADGLTPWTAVGTSTGARVAIAIVPVYRMILSEEQKEFAGINHEPLTVQLVEA